MPRIPPEEIERLKKEIPIQRLAEARGIKLKAQGKDLVGLCPFREEKTASLHITPANNLWHCFGCNEGGTNIEWVKKTDGVSFRHAVEILREWEISQGSSSGKPVKIATVPKLQSPISFDAEDRELMNQVIEYYHQTLKQSPEALAYLEKRGLKNSEMIDRFKIGYSNRTLGIRLPEKNRAAGAAIRERLTKIGIYRETGHEHFNGAVVIPIFDEHSQVTEIYGRKIIDNLREGTVYHLYLPGPHKGVFNLEALQTNKEIILCEALIDALTFWCAGFRNVTASYGVNGLTSDHWEAFKKYGVEKVYIAYDADNAGDKAAKELSETCLELCRKELISKNFECFRILFPHGLDANEYALKVKPPEKSLDLMIRNAESMCERKRESVQVPEIQQEENQPLKELSIPKPETFSPLAAKEEAKPIPEIPVSAPQIPVEIKAEEIIIFLDDRRWRVRGLGKNMSYDQIKVNLCVSKGKAYHLDTLDLYSARSRASFIKQASGELQVNEDVIKKDIGQLLSKLEELQNKQIKETLEPKEKEVVLTEAEKAEAMKLLKDPTLLDRILSDFEKCGLVGEATNKLVGYLAAVSRKIEKPLGIIIQSSSSSGKTALMEAVLTFMPEEERVKYSAMTGQALFYMGETNLQHKILAIVEEEGAERASYALKLLQSEGALSIASTGKDPVTGRLATNTYKVQGPVMIFVTTTNIEIDPELQNRCIMLTVDESREQTRAIQRIQREMKTLVGLIVRKEKARLLKLHQNAQRLLKPIYVVNMFAQKLTFLDDQTRTRRDNEKYLGLIETITLLHQHQRPLKTSHETGEPVQCLEVTVEDIEIANRLADEVLGHSLDELAPQTRRLLMTIEKMVLEACQLLNIEQPEYRFSQRDVREYTGMGNTQVKTHLRRLEEFEYLIAHRNGRGLSFGYELIYDGKGKDGKPFLSGLIDVAKLREKHGYDENRSEYLDDRSVFSQNQSPPSRGEVMPLSGGCRNEKIVGKEQPISVSEESKKIPLKTTDTDIAGKSPSYPKNNRKPNILPIDYSNGSGLRDIQ